MTAQRIDHRPKRDRPPASFKECTLIVRVPGKPLLTEVFTDAQIGLAQKHADEHGGQIHLIEDEPKTWDWDAGKWIGTSNT